MKPVGRSRVYDLKKVREGIELYYKSTLSWDEVSEKTGIPKNVMQYHRRKELRQNGGTQTDQ